MKTNYLYQLAEQVAGEKSISETTADFVLNSLSKSRQKIFLQHLRRVLSRDTLYVTSSTPIDSVAEKSLLSHFDKKYLDNQVTPSIGAGLVIKNNDDIIDLSLAGEIRRFIQTIA